MLNFERQQEILEILTREKCVTVERLAKALFASAATIRRDFTEMEKRGQLTRVHGGAALNTGSNAEAPLLLRTKKEQEKKRRIAELALPLLSGSKTVFMDSSSTVTALAQLMSGCGDLSIVTNGIHTAAALKERTDSRVYLTGGLLQGNDSLVGKAAVDMVKGSGADVLFFSCCGLTERGTWEAAEENALIKAALAENASRRVLLCDSTKLGRQFFWNTVAAARIDLLITDAQPPEALRAVFSGKLLVPPQKETLHCPPPKASSF